MEFLFDINVTKQDVLLNPSRPGHTEIAKFLMGKGKEVFEDKDRALVNAAHVGNLDILKLLVQKGANIYARNYGALIIASNNHQIDVFDFVRKDRKHSHTLAGS